MYFLKKILSLGISFSLVLVSYSSKANNEAIKLPAIVEVRGITDEKILKNASVSFYAVNLNTKEVVYAINPHVSLVPASSLKLLTTATGLEVLGKDFKFQTKLQYDGKINARGILSGNIYIQGGGDPALGSHLFKEHYYEPYFIANWVEAIKAQGIKKIKGAIIGDAQLYESYITPDTWAVEDLGNNYGAGYSGLSIFDNMYEMLLMVNQTDETKLDIIQISPQLPKKVKIINQLKRTGKKLQCCVYGSPYQNKRIIKGTVPQDKLTLTLKGSIPDPAYWAAYTLSKELKRQSVSIEKQPTTMRHEKKRLQPAQELQITVQGKQQIKTKSKNKKNLKNDQGTSTRNDLYITYSPLLKDIAGIINRESNNLYAEHIINHLGLRFTGKGDTESGIKTVIDFWGAAGIDTTGMFLHDGSGLSRYNAITTKQLVDMLCYMKSSKNFEAFYHSLPIAGETGTLKEIFTKAPLKGNLKAKTGSMKRVLSYTGYCTTISGAEIAFSCIVNNYNSTPKDLRIQIEKLLISLVNESLSLNY